MPFGPYGVSKNIDISVLTRNTAPTVGHGHFLWEITNIQDECGFKLASFAPLMAMLQCVNMSHRVLHAA